MAKLQANVLMNNGDHTTLNENYVRILTGPEYAPPIFSEPQYPDPNWLKHLSQTMPTDAAIELYNHYLIWYRVLKTSEPEAILYNQGVPNQPDWVMKQLLYAPLNLFPDKTLNIDVVLYGKYSDLCNRYIQVSNVPVTSNFGKVYNFSLYKTVSPYGGYAYFVTPSGARKLINMIISDPKPIDQMINRLAEIGNVLTYNPSIIILNNPDMHYECRTPGTDVPLRGSQGWATFIWYLVLFVLIGIIIGAMVYFISSNLKYKPNKEIPFKYTGPETVVIPYYQPDAKAPTIYYGSTRTPT